MNHAPSRAPAPNSDRLSKTPRREIVHLTIESEVCPDVVLRILGIIARIGYAPLGISMMRTRDGQQLEIQLDPLPETVAETLLARIENIVNVRTAGIGRSPST